jgi:predicted membrane-bound spermidine synthase
MRNLRKGNDSLTAQTGSSSPASAWRLIARLRSPSPLKRAILGRFIALCPLSPTIHRRATRRQVVSEYPLKSEFAVVFALFLVSASGLIFEITLTRLFSLYFQYHFAFLAVSVAVLGLSLGAAVGRFVVPAGRIPTDGKVLPIILSALSLSFPLAAIAIAWLPSAASVLPYAAVALVPFVLIGLFSALAFARFAKHSGLLYAADLTGAAVGVVLVLGLLTLGSVFNVVILLGAAAGLAAFVLASLRRYRLGAFLALVFSASLLGVNLSTGWIDYSPERLADAPRDKTMIAVLNDPSQDTRLVYTAGGPFARVDVVETEDPETKFIFTDGGAGSYMLRFDGGLEDVAHLRDSVEFIPFALGATERTLVIGAGAGRDVVLALLAGAEQITAVEVNPAMVKATRHFADYNGQILDRPEVELVVGDARTFVERSADCYDLIYLNLVYTQAAEPASQSLVENYIFTRQAFRAYLDHLAPGGHLAIVSHSALEGSRAAITALQVLEDAGKSLPQALEHMALLMVPADDPTQRTTVMVLGKEPLRDEEIQELAAGANRLGMQPLFLSGVFELPFAPLLQGSSLEEFLAGDPTYDLSPTDDDQPYFFKLDPGLPSPVQQALMAAVALSVALLLLSLWPTGTAGGRWRWVGLVIYAALIGAGFMLVEIPLIQRFQLLLGYPVLSVVAVLGTLLLAAGLGSVLSQRWPETGLLRRVIWAALWIGAVALVYWLVLPLLVRQLLGALLAWRVLATIGLTAMLGIPLGIPFPSLMRLARQYRQRVALLWALSGAFSVLGSTLAVVLSMTWGFSWALATGAGLYLLLAALAWRLMHSLEVF